MKRKYHSPKALLFNFCAIVALFFFSLSLKAQTLQDLEFFHTQLATISPEKAPEIEKVEKNILRFMLLAAGKDDDEKYRLFSKARDYAHWEFQKIRSGGQGLEVPQWTLNEEIRFIENSLPESEGLSPVQVRELNSWIDNFSGGELQHFIEGGDDRERALRVVNTFEEKFDTQIQRIRHMGTELSNSNQIKMGNPDIERFVVRFLDYYYQKLDVDVVKNILSDLIELGRYPTQTEMMVTVFKNSGPGVGKLFQQLAREPQMGASLASLLETLEDDNKIVPEHLMREVLEGDRGGHRFRDIQGRPLGTGTMAQVNKATLIQANEEIPVAVRFLKPGISELAARDIEILKNFIDEPSLVGQFDEELLPSMRKIIDSLEDFLMSELDLEATIEKQAQAQRVYQRALQLNVDGKTFHVDIDVPRVYPTQNGHISNLHVQEFVSSGSKFSEINSSTAQKAVGRAIVHTWFEEAIINSGFIHADLHQGNFTVSAMGENRFRVTLFDLGMSENLDKNLRRSFLLISSGARYEDPKLITRGFQLLSPSIDYQALLQTITEKMREGNESTEKWIAWGMKKGLLQSEKIGTLARGATLVSQIPSIVGQEEMNQTLKAVERMTAKKVAIDYFRPRYEFPLTRTDIALAGRAYSKMTCTKLVNKVLSRR